VDTTKNGVGGGRSRRDCYIEKKEEPVTTVLNLKHQGEKRQETQKDDVSNLAVPKYLEEKTEDLVHTL